MAQCNGIISININYFFSKNSVYYFSGTKQDNWNYICYKIVKSANDQDAACKLDREAHQMQSQIEVTFKTMSRCYGDMQLAVYGGSYWRLSKIKDLAFLPTSLNHLFDST